MKKDIAKLMAIRMGVYVLLVGYLGCDLFVFQGPVHRSLNEVPEDKEARIAEAKASGVAARVYYRPIFKAQVEESIKEYLWRRGRTIEETSAGERRSLRLLIVNQLIDDELVKLQIKVSMSEEVAVPEEQVENALALELQRYPDEKVFEKLADSAGWSGQKERRSRLAARIQRGEHLERMVDISLSDQEVSAWIESNKERLSDGSDENQAAIRDSLLAIQREAEWEKFRVARLRRYAEGKIELFKDVLYAEEPE